MTKQIRIENADTSSYKVKVHLQDRVALDDKEGNDWVTVHTINLDYPTAMTAQYIHSGRRIIIEELNDPQHEH